MLINGKDDGTGAFIFEKVRFCKRCGDEVKFGEPDPCLGNYLPGIAYCCCGHGDLGYAYCVGWPNCTPECSPSSHHKDDEGYFKFRGQEALDYMEKLINEGSNI